MLKVGLTGGVGSGKSIVAKFFAEFGISIIDADVIAKELVQPQHPVLKEIVQHFGSDLLDGQGQLDRKKMRELIFPDREKRQWLEHKLHPLIIAEMQTQSENASSPYCVLVIPLLIENKASRKIIDRILLVDAAEDLRIERIKQRDNISQDQVIKMMQSQAQRAERLRLADDVINNDQDLGHLKTQVKRLHEYYLVLAQKT